MSSVSLPRRSFLSLALLLATKSAFANSLVSSESVFLSAASDSDEKHWLKAFTIDNDQLKELYSHQLSARAHDVVLNNKSDLFICVARRPGTFLLVGDVTKGNVLQEIQALEGRHFYGHGVFSADD